MVFRRLLKAAQLAIALGLGYSLAMRGHGSAQAANLAQQAKPPRDRVATGFQAIPVGSASIEGRVVSAVGDRPISFARVLLNGRAGSSEPPPSSSVERLANDPTNDLSVSRSVLTDAGGRFSFAKLPAGQFSISVLKDNFLAANYGQRRPGSPGGTIVLAEDQRFVADIRMTKGGVITGAILDEMGQPIARAQVTAWRLSLVGGVKRMVQTAGATSDDRGVYRISNLQPAAYVVGVIPNTLDSQMASLLNPDAAAIERAILEGQPRPPSAPGKPMTVLAPVSRPFGSGSSLQQGYLPTYYPRTPLRSAAQLIRVAGGDEHSDIEIVPDSVRGGSISGTVTPSIRPGVIARVALLSSDPAIDGTPIVLVDQAGHFTFRSVAPGAYTVLVQATEEQANRSGSSSTVLRQTEGIKRLWGSAAVVVDREISTDTTIALHEGRQISGVVTFEMTKRPDLLRNPTTISLVPVAGSPAPLGRVPEGVIEVDGTFKITQVIPGRYSVRLNGDSAYLKSAMLGPTDILDFPFDFDGTNDLGEMVLTVTDRFSELGGLLTDSTGRPATNYTVIAASTDQRFWTPNSRRISVARVGADGRYLFRSLPPGDYFLSVETDLESGAQYDPDSLMQMSRQATRVHVTDGARSTQDFQINKAGSS